MLSKLNVNDEFSGLLRSEDGIATSSDVMFFYRLIEGLFIGKQLVCSETCFSID